MKQGHAIALAGAVVVVVVASAVGCSHPQRRNDWRSPAPRMAPTDSAPGQAPPGDGGAAPGQPGVPSVQPSPSDIQI